MITAFTVYPQSGFTFTLGAGYGTASELYPYAGVSDFDLSKVSVGLGSLVTPHISVGYRFNGDLRGVLALEYLSKTAEFYGQTVENETGTIFIPVKDGYSFLPVELSLEYILPFSSEALKVYIGGGAGIYFYSSKREVAGIKPKSGGNITGYGIHILSGMEYFFSDNLGILFTMKFRDPEVLFDGEYASDAGVWNGMPVRLGNTKFREKLSLEGTMFILGLKTRF
ncbi:MAG: hypothetical protein B6D45_05225 [Ignavibacteriales bacterium UTCHB3]|nr:MAG: hypothetical protein B6D45_05225 [Ignavibacteriales bacterium UTCHB3]